MAQENEMDVSQLVAPSSSATVHGVFVGAVSPVKTSRKNSSVIYFERCCNLRRLFHCGMVDNTNKYGSTVTTPFI